MQRVFKYAIQMEDYFSLNLPKGAKILTVQEQRGELQMWVLVKEGVSSETRKFRLAGKLAIPSRKVRRS